MSNYKSTPHPDVWITPEGDALILRASGEHSIIDKRSIEWPHVVARQIDRHGPEALIAHQALRDHQNEGPAYNP